jgi:hypothetical protein
MEPPTQLKIVPHVGIGPVRLGMTRAEVAAALAVVPNALPGHTERGPSKVDCYLRASIQIMFEKDETASLIEVACDPSTLCTYKGHDVFDLSGPELFAILAADDLSGEHLYNSSEYVFPELMVALWDADSQYDRKGNESRPVYAAVAVGDERYLALIRKLRDRLMQKKV